VIIKRVKRAQKRTSIHLTIETNNDDYLANLTCHYNEHANKEKTKFIITNISHPNCQNTFHWSR